MRTLYSMKSKLTAAVIAAVGFAAVAFGHHSVAMFDFTKRIELVGVIKEFQWTNPHSWVQFVAPKDGKEVEWSIESNSPNVLTRLGWTRSTLKPGDKVTLTIAPTRDGSASGLLMKVLLSDGTDITAMPNAAGTK